MAEVITVSALNQYVKTLLDANDILFDLALRGETPAAATVISLSGTPAPVSKR